MKSVINKVEMRREWVLTNWAEKTVYVIGIIYLSLLALGFVIGFVLGIMGR